MGDGGWGGGAIVSDILITNLSVGPVCPCPRLGFLLVLELARGSVTARAEWRERRGRRKGRCWCSWRSAQWGRVGVHIGQLLFESLDV